MNSASGPTHGNLRAGENAGSPELGRKCRTPKTTGHPGQTNRLSATDTETRIQRETSPHERARLPLAAHPPAPAAHEKRQIKRSRGNRNGGFPSGRTGEAGTSPPADGEPRTHGVEKHTGHVGATHVCARSLTSTASVFSI